MTRRAPLAPPELPPPRVWRQRLLASAMNSFIMIDKDVHAYIELLNYSTRPMSSVELNQEVKPALEIIKITLTMVRVLDVTDSHP